MLIADQYGFKDKNFSTLQPPENQANPKGGAMKKSAESYLFPFLVGTVAVTILSIALKSYPFIISGIILSWAASVLLILNKMTFSEFFLFKHLRKYPVFIGIFCGGLAIFAGVIANSIWIAFVEVVILLVYILLQYPFEKVEVTAGTDSDSVFIPPNPPKDIVHQFHEPYLDFDDPRISDEHFEKLKARWPKLSGDLALLGNEGHRQKNALLARITATQLAERLTGNIDDLDTWEGLIGLLGTVQSDFEIAQKEYFEKKK